MKKHYDNDVLKQLHGKIVKRDIASYDIETYTNKNIFLMGGFIDAKGHYKSFFDKDTMISYMLKHTDKNTWIFATNNSFDHYALFGQEKTFLKEKPLLRGSLMIHSKYKHMNFYDTRAFTKATVEALGNMLGKPKIRLSMTNNKKHMTGKERRRMITYNKRDCEITRDFMKQLQEVLNNLGGNLKTTIGSSAMDLYRRKYLKENIHHEYNKQFSDGILLKDFLKRSYHGARTEMFKRGYDKDKIYYYYDFNSLYPSVMLTGYPKPSSAQLYRNNEGKINNTNLQFEGVSECEVLCPYMYYPLLSVYVNNKLCFPIGRFRGVFTHIELREAEG